MHSKNDILNIMKTSLDNLHKSGTLDEGLNFNEEQVLLGSSSPLDSIGFVSFITEFEDLLQEATNQEIYLVLNDIQEFNINNPNLTVGILADYVTNLVTATSSS